VDEKVQPPPPLQSLRALASRVKVAAGYLLHRQHRETPIKAPADQRAATLLARPGAIKSISKTMAAMEWIRGRLNEASGWLDMAARAANESCFGAAR